MRNIPLKLIWLMGSLVLVTIFALLIDLTVQQNFRQSANDPQIQLAEDTANNLNNKEPAVSLIGNAKIDVGKSLAPFLIIYDDSGKVVDSTVTLDGQTPSLPAGVFDEVKRNGEKRFTWQPTNEVRIATVVVKSDSGFVLSGRNLREVEIRESNLDSYVIAAWLGSIVVIGACFFLGNLKAKS